VHYEPALLKTERPGNQLAAADGGLIGHSLQFLPALRSNNKHEPLEKGEA
jgi:hypothetical protein